MTSPYMDSTVTATATHSKKIILLTLARLQRDDLKTATVHQTGAKNENARDFLASTSLLN